MDKKLRTLIRKNTLEAHHAARVLFETNKVSHKEFHADLKQFKVVKKQDSTNDFSELKLLHASKELIEKFNKQNKMYVPIKVLGKIIKCNKKIHINNALIEYWKERKINHGKIKKLEADNVVLTTMMKDYRTNWINKTHATYIKKIEHTKRPNRFADEKFSISLANVEKYYYNKSIAFKVLKRVKLEIDNGEFVVILGPSGSGKTTLLNIISGMDSATYGDVNICGINIVNKNSTQLTRFRKENIGYIFQQYGLLPNLTVRENIEIGSNLQEDTSRRIPIDDILRDLGIWEFKGKMPYELSGGQQQRVSIARSIAKNPRIIFADEPTGAVDEKMSKQIMQLLIDVNKKYGTTIVIVTHNPIIAQLATKVVVVENGTISNIISNTPKAVNKINWGIGLEGLK